MRCVVAAAVVCAACGHAGLHRPGVDPALANELVAWDGVRMHAEARLLAVPLPAITVREPAGATAAVAVTIAIPRVAPHLPSVAVEWPTICERRGVLADDVFT